jgi:hypothetical protein
MMGTNGSYARVPLILPPAETSFDGQRKVRDPKSEELTAPINIMYVDRRGKAALVVLRKARETIG